MKKRNRNHFNVAIPFISYTAATISTFLGLLILCANLEGWWQSVVISLETGIISSFVVSLAFWAMQKVQERKIANKRRRDFMEQFKIESYNIIHDINVAYCQNTILSLNAYIKSQHRWFHDYYKRMDAENTNESETELRIKQITQFVENYERNLRSIFEARVMWEDGKFSNWQLKELKSFYKEFCDCKYYIERKNYMFAFLSFAQFLEIFKRIMTEDDFIELECFDLMQFAYDDTGTLKINDEKFIELEKLFKFANELNMIRMKNYKKYYGKNSESVDEEHDNGQVKDDVNG